MLVNNMKIAAADAGVEVEIDAHSQGKIADYLDEIDVALLGPQVAYTLDKSKALCDEKQVPIAVIPMADYGMLDGKKFFNWHSAWFHKGVWSCPKLIHKNYCPNHEICEYERDHRSKRWYVGYLAFNSSW